MYTYLCMLRRNVNVEQVVAFSNGANTPDSIPHTLRAGFPRSVSNGVHVRCSSRLSCLTTAFEISSEEAFTQTGAHSQTTAVSTYGRIMLTRSRRTGASYVPPTCARVRRWTAVNGYERRISSKMNEHSRKNADCFTPLFRKKRVASPPISGPYEYDCGDATAKKTPIETLDMFAHPSF